MNISQMLLSVDRSEAPFRRQRVEVSRLGRGVPDAAYARIAAERLNPGWQCTDDLGGAILLDSFVESVWVRGTVDVFSVAMVPVQNAGR